MDWDRPGPPDPGFDRRRHRPAPPLPGVLPQRLADPGRVIHPRHVASPAGQLQPLFPGPFPAVCIARFKSEPPSAFGSHCDILLLPGITCDYFPMGELGRVEIAGAVTTLWLWKETLMKGHLVESYNFGYEFVFADDDTLGNERRFRDPGSSHLFRRKFFDVHLSGETIKLC